MAWVANEVMPCEVKKKVLNIKTSECMGLYCKGMHE